MARFTVRVQLHGADEGDDAYDTLHAQMKKRGFVRTIESESTTYRPAVGVVQLRWGAGRSTTSWSARRTPPRRPATGGGSS